MIRNNEGLKGMCIVVEKKIDTTLRSYNIFGLKIEIYTNRRYYLIQNTMELTDD